MKDQHLLWYLKSFGSNFTISAAPVFYDIYTYGQFSSSHFRRYNTLEVEMKIMMCMLLK